MLSLAQEWHDRKASNLYLLFAFFLNCQILFSLPLCLTGYVKLPPEKFAQKKQGEASKDLPTEPKKLQLNSAEELYAEIRDKNFNAVGAALSKKAKIISAAFEVGLALTLLVLVCLPALLWSQSNVSFLT